VLGCQGGRLGVWHDVPCTRLEAAPECMCEGVIEGLEGGA
jgi:hypothetical protein